MCGTNPHLSEVFSQLQVLLQATSGQIQAGQIHACLNQMAQLLAQLPALDVTSLQRSYGSTHRAAGLPHLHLHMLRQSLLRAMGLSFLSRLDGVVVFLLFFFSSEACTDTHCTQKDRDTCGAWSGRDLDRGFGRGAA